MRINTGVVTFLLLPWLAISALSSADTGFYISPKIGVSDIDIDDNFGPLITDENGTLWGVHASAGFKTPFWLVVEVGAGFAENVEAFGSAFDNTELRDQRYSLGLAIPIGNHVRLVPKAGRFRWRLKLEEGQFASPGPELSSTVEKSEGFYSLDAEYLPLDWLAIDAALFYANTDFGRVRSLQFGVQFEF